MLAYGLAADALNEYLQMSEDSALLYQRLPRLIALLEKEIRERCNCGSEKCTGACVKKGKRVS
eukprot:IDg15491t1